MPNGKARHSDARRRKDGASHLRPSVAAKPSLREIGIGPDSRDRFVSALHTTPGFLKSSSSSVANMHRVSPDAVVSARIPPDRHHTPYSASSNTKPGTLPLRTICQPAPRAEPSRLLGLSRSLPISHLPCFPPNEAASRSPASALAVGRTNVGLVSMYARAPVATTELWMLILREALQTAWPRLSTKSATDACMLPSPQLRDGALPLFDCHPHTPGHDDAWKFRRERRRLYLLRYRGEHERQGLG
ncbi:hypothetical protein DFH08DRAFT_882749, partial [Mycena albidolilacea]